MAKIFGAAGEHAGRQSVVAFKRMFATVLVLSVLVAFFEGILLAALFITHNQLGWVVVPAVAVLLLWLMHHANKRVDRFETERMAWRKGALGEYEVGAELERLSDDYTVFNNVNTEEFGNFDHIVVGPHGIFALETKNWAGLISADAAGELTRNAKPSSQPHVRRLEQKLMMLREQILALTRRDDLFVRGLMVFPEASVSASFGKTRSIHCLRIEKLRDYIDNTKSARKFSADEIAKLVRAVKAVAEMDEEFAARASSNP